MVRALEGVRILDLTRQMSGPYGTMFLADHGAEVIKVESLPGGDGSRSVGTDFLGDQSALFLIWNRGKRSLAVDLRDPRGVALVRRLAGTCDVVVENYRPGVADEIGLGYDTLAGDNPRLIYVSVSAFGQQGPLAPYPGTDPVVQGVSGVMSVTGEADGPPLLVGIPVADFAGAMSCAQAVMLGLLARDRTGEGQRIDVSMLFSLLSALTTRLATHWTTGEDPTRFGSQHSVVAPYQAFETADGHAVAGVWGGRDGWERFCRAVERTDLLDDPRFRTNPDRVTNRAALTETLQTTFRSRTTADWEQRFNAERALFGPVLTFSQVLAHPQVTGAGMVTEVEHPTAGTIPQLAPAIQLSRTPGAITAPPPLLGQHTREVLAELGLPDDEVGALLEQGVVAEPDPIGVSTPRG
jgi:crotonobetainyl-CoA:carnitine CoA-transferase CaiB-like acyl-CoA transferase